MQKNEGFKIYVEQLRDGHHETIQESFDPGFLKIKEKDLIFKKNVEVKGEAYIADTDLILRLNIAAEAEIPCSICNELTPIPIYLENEYITELLSNIPSGVFDFEGLLREAVLLEVPSFTECHQGSCPQRKEIKKYLKKESAKNGDEDHYYPFADL